MALKGNGYYMFDELTICSSPLNYPTSTTASWHSGISNYGMKMSHPPSQTTTTATVVSSEGAIPRPVKSCYGLDELLPFSPHSLDNTNRGNLLQSGKLASEQSALSNLFGPSKELQSKCNVSAEDSSGSDHSTEDPQSKKCARKRKILPRDKARGDPSLNPWLGENTEKESEGKRPKIGEGTNEKPDLKSEVEQNSKDSQQSVKPPEPPKDYIHVRARRGQATDSHSLAERVRREKISERMKLLQDLVPGCNKITGKAVMLDEIINYVQSLQHQVEFLSMKLEAVNPRLDFNTEGFLTKDMHEPSSIAFTSNTAIAYPQFPQPEWAHMQLGMSRNIEEPSMGNNRELSLKSMMNGHISPAESCGDPIPQMPNGWDNELQSVVQLGFGQNIQPSFTAQSFQGPFSTSYTNIEH